MASPLLRQRHRCPDFPGTAHAVMRTVVGISMSFIPEPSATDGVARTRVLQHRFPSATLFQVLELLAFHRPCCPRLTRPSSHQWMVQSASLVPVSLALLSLFHPNLTV